MLEVLQRVRSRIGEIAGTVDEAQYRINSRMSSGRGNRRGSQNGLNDTIADALVDQLFVITDHLRVQLVEVLSVLAIGPVGDRAVETIDNVSEEALNAVKELASKIDEVFDGVDRIVDIGEKLTLTNVVVEKPVKIGTRVLNRLMTSIDNIIGAIGKNR
jgi:hypothetical protein